MNFNELLGMTLTKCFKQESNAQKGLGEELHFHTDTGRVFKLYHSQSCCEQVYIESIDGDLDDLIGVPILQAEEVEHNRDNQPPPPEDDPSWRESYTWTFYKLATWKGYVTIRWFGESNGYYSESVDFREVDSDGNVIWD